MSNTLLSINMKKVNPDKKQTLAVCLPKDIVAWIKDNAQKDNRTVSGYVTHLLTNARDEFDENH
jgi:hypothetical protein